MEAFVLSWVAFGVFRLFAPQRHLEHVHGFKRAFCSRSSPSSLATSASAPPYVRRQSYSVAPDTPPRRDFLALSRQSPSRQRREPTSKESPDHRQIAVPVSVEVSQRCASLGDHPRYREIGAHETSEGRKSRPSGAEGWNQDEQQDDVGDA